MAYIEPRKNKKGEIISYRIRVNKGYDANGKKLNPYQMTFKPDPDKSDRQNAKALNETAVEFEKKCKQGYVADSKQTFRAYSEYAMRMKERAGVKHSTLVRYEAMLKDINTEIGHLRLTEIRPQTLNVFYESLEKTGVRKTAERAAVRVDFKEFLKSKKITQEELHKKSGVGMMTIRSAINGGNILLEKAQRLCDTLGVPLTKLFIKVRDKSVLSNKTIREYHRLISSILALADKEMIIPFNPAAKATPPKVKRSKVNFFELDQLEQIQGEVDKLPIKWRTIIHLLMITGCRRGEIAGLKWETVDWENHQLYICRTLLYSPDIGVYEETPKTRSGYRYIALPTETMQLLKEYKQYYDNMSIKWADRWHDTGYLFVQEKAENAGKPINPDGITAYLNDFSEKYDLPHINPHAFRHTQASLLYYGGMDSVSISKRLGHSKVSTTTDLYAHIIRQADERNAECIADTVLRSNRIEISRKENRA
ncbi:MAG: tyrosine-type recombinase/integrase [Ruminococcus sp.]|nr:tyrosine-type recombinase/integrase [Ruminococcus sp.]